MKQAFAFLAGAVMLAGCTIMGPASPPTFNVFFKTGSAELTPTATEIVDSAAARIRNHPPGTVVISAGAAPGDNLQYADARFRAVQTELAAKGVDSAIVARATLVETQAEVGPMADRRVEIKLLADKTP